jgi:hypothetical protein
VRCLIAALLALGGLGASGVLAGTASAAPAGTTHYPDLQTIIPLSSFSIASGAEGREFRYTHLVYNNGPGPLEIQPQYNPVSGTYQGMQRLFTHDAAGNWSLVSEVRVPDAFEFHAAHGHFHFPLAAFGLYQVAPGGGIGAPVSISPKNGFCIDDSYIYNTSVEHSGAFVGQKGSCADPTTLRGLSVGGADEYDYRDPGQSIPFQGVPDGTYWFRAITDPHNDLVEGDESNNETDVLVTISNSKVTTGTVLHPDTTPPAVTLTTPSGGGFVSGPLALTATSPVPGLSQIEFIVDGVPVGTSADTSSPYHLTWDSTTVPDGEHWLAARATDAQGRINTSAVVPVNIANAGPPPPPEGLGIDASASADGRGTLTQPIQVRQSHTLLLCLLSSDGPSGGGQTATVSGGGLSWSLVRRANARLGTSEIWKADGPADPGSIAVTSTPNSGGFDQSFTVLAFAGADGVGASSAASGATGAPSTNVTTTRDGSWVLGVGNDWDRAVSRVVGQGQVIRHEWVDSSAGDTFWVQSQAALTPVAGTNVPISDTAPTNDQWNLAAAEVLPSSTSPPPPPPQDTTPPQVSITDPDPGETVSGIIAIGAVAADNVGVGSVEFKIDGVPLGAPVTSPPFMAQWDTRTFSAGQHTITAEATDTSGNVATSTGVNVTVDNSAPPPANIEIDTKQVRHTTGTLTSPAIKTSAAGDVLVAYVGLDGPSAAGSQTATVSGAGLTWSLVKRSNTQAGDAEIWSAKATSQLTNATVTATPEKAGYSGSLAVIAYKGAAGVGIAGASGAPSGAPDIYLPGIGMGSWVFAVGNDWDRAVARTPVADQVLQDQWVATSVGDTFWVQSTAAPNTAPSLVTIHDNAPTSDRWNYAAVEIVPALASTPSPPGAPSLTATVPTSPANQNSPKVLGSAASGSQVSIYTTADCSGAPLATGIATDLAAGITVSVADDSTTALRATATTAGGTSSCSPPLTYVEDSTAPDTTVTSGPSGTTNDPTPTFEFSSNELGSSFECRFDSTTFGPCSGPGSTHTPVPALPDGPHAFEVRAVDAAGNVDQTPAARSFTVDTSAPPPAPILTSTIPASPANQNSPKVLGSAASGSQVSIYTTPDCSGPALATGAATDLAAGITVSVADDSATALRATATTAGGTSSCSLPLAYVEDSTAPQTQIGAHPLALSASSSASFQFAGEDPGGAGVASLQCRLDSTEAAAWAPCASPKVYASLPDGVHRFEARAIDGAGNADLTPASFEWQIDTIPPPVAIDSGPAGETTDSTPTFEFHSTEAGVALACSIDTGTASFGPCSGPGASHTPASPLALGSYTFRVRAMDAAGNQATATRAFTVGTGTPSLALDETVTTHQGSAAKTISAPALTTARPGELLLALVASDGPSSGSSQSISGVTGGGLTWTLRQRANAQAGTAEIWQAVAPTVLTNAVVTATRAKGSYQGSISVAAFIGANTSLSGAVGSASGPSGTPTGTLVTTRAGGWVWAVGDDWDNATARTVGSGQTLVDQYLSPSKDTFWIQRRTEPTALAGSSVTINDTAPSGDRWNLAFIEVPPASTGP